MDDNEPIVETSFYIDEEQAARMNEALQAGQARRIKLIKKILEIVHEPDFGPCNKKCGECFNCRLYLTVTQLDKEGLWLLPF